MFLMSQIQVSTHQLFFFEYTETRFKKPIPISSVASGG
jgi:hypothetical protein